MMTTVMSADSDVVDVVTAMLDAGARSMPIVDRIRLVGILTRRDLVRASACNDQAIGADVRRRLQMYGEADRWNVEFHDVTSLSVASSTTPPTGIRPPCWPKQHPTWLLENP